MLQATDRAIWDYAVSIGAVIVTKDEDFAVRRGAGDDGPAVLWVRIGNTRRVTLLDWFARALSRAIVRLNEGSGVVEIRA